MMGLGYLGKNHFAAVLVAAIALRVVSFSLTPVSVLGSLWALGFPHALGQAARIPGFRSSRFWQARPLSISQTNIRVLQNLFVNFFVTSRSPVQFLSIRPAICSGANSSCDILAVPIPPCEISMKLGSDPGCAMGNHGELRRANP